MVLRIFRPESIEEALERIRETQADERSYPYMAPKALGLCIEIRDLNARDANILKQEALSKGGDASISVAAYALEGSSRVLLMGSLKVVEETARKLDAQPIGRLKDLSADIRGSIKNYFSTPVFKVGYRSFEQTVIMGILNVTPDSFYDGGHYTTPELAVSRAEQIEREGGDIIDIGGQSTRPGYVPVNAEEEKARVMPALRAILENTSVRLPISVDTSKPKVVEEALKLGASMINDQEGLHGNERIAQMAADYEASLIMMHNRNTAGKDMMFDILAYLGESISIAESCGVEHERTSVDPGIGFGKGAEGDLGIIKNLGELRVLGRAITVGASRKSFIGKVLGEKEDRLEGSIAALACSVMNGARIIRVHDVKESVLATRMVEAVLKMLKYEDSHLLHGWDGEKSDGHSFRFSQEERRRYWYSAIHVGRASDSV
jgi:dihydropteroate synthase